VNNILRIGNLPASATEADLREKFAKFGTVQAVTVRMNSSVGRSRRFGIVEMATDAEARLAVARLNMTQYEDMTISVCAMRTDN
jgi:RNA recognition motif-containing protein